MADTPTSGETAKPGDSQTPVQTPATPVVNAVDPAEVERLRKEAEQARMRANQLQNQLDEKAKADEAARQKQLEEQNEWKQIAEQNKAKLEAYESEKEEAQRANALQSATNEVLGTFSDEVRELATDMGLALNDDSEEAKEAFKQKLEKISAKVAADRKPGANNPAPGSPSAPREELLARTRKGDPAAKAQLINDFPAIKEMRRLAGQSQ